MLLNILKLFHTHIAEMTFHLVDPKSMQRVNKRRNRGPQKPGQVAEPASQLMKMIP